MKKRTALVSILHSANWISESRTQTEACFCAIIVCLDDFVRQDFHVVGRFCLAVVKLLVRQATRTSKSLNITGVMDSLTCNNRYTSMNQVDQTSAQLPLHKLLSLRSSIRSVCCQHHISQLHCHHKPYYIGSPMTREHLHRR